MVYIPNFAELSQHSTYSKEVWEEAWNILKNNFSDIKALDAWSVVCDLNHRIHINPHDLAKDLVKYMNRNKEDNDRSD